MNSIKVSCKLDCMIMDSGNSKTSDFHRLLLNLTDKITLKRSDKYIALSSFSIYYTWKNITRSQKNNKFKRSAPTWNEKFELIDGSFSVLNIKYCFQYIMKKHETLTDNPPILIYVNKIENSIRYKFKARYYLEILTPETMKILESTNGEITIDENGENVPHLEIAEVVLVHCYIVSNDYQKN